MEKEFVTYAEALALKELHFDEPCFGIHYSEGLNHSFMMATQYGEHGATANGGILAPLYQQAFRWLLVLVNKDEHFSNKWTISYNEDYYSLFLGGCNMGVFKAEQECLKKLIELVKEKK